MPAGWSSVKVPGNRFKVAVEPEQSGYRADIQVFRQPVPRRFDLSCAGKPGQPARNCSRGR
jgi:hypothetical protein